MTMIERLTSWAGPGLKTESVRTLAYWEAKSRDDGQARGAWDLADGDPDKQLEVLRIELDCQHEGMDLSTHTAEHARQVIESSPEAIEALQYRFQSIARRRNETWKPMIACVRENTQPGSRLHVIACARTLPAKKAARTICRALQDEHAKGGKEAISEAIGWLETVRARTDAARVLEHLKTHTPAHELRNPWRRLLSIAFAREGMLAQVRETANLSETEAERNALLTHALNCANHRCEITLAMTEEAIGALERMRGKGREHASAQTLSAAIRHLTDPTRAIDRILSLPDPWAERPGWERTEDLLAVAERTVRRNGNGQAALAIAAEAVRRMQPEENPGVPRSLDKLRTVLERLRSRSSPEPIPQDLVQFIMHPGWERIGMHTRTAAQASALAIELAQRTNDEKAWEKGLERACRSQWTELWPIEQSVIGMDPEGIATLEKIWRRVYRKGKLDRVQLEWVRNRVNHQGVRTDCWELAIFARSPGDESIQAITAMLQEHARESEDEESG